MEALIGKTKEDTIFALTGALSARNLTLALQTLHDLIDQGLHPLMIMTMITKEIRFLFQAKLLIASGRLGSSGPDGDYGRFQKTVYPAVRKLAGDGKEAIALVSQHPFVVYQALKNAGRFTRAELAGYLELLLEDGSGPEDDGTGSPPSPGATPDQGLRRRFAFMISTYPVFASFLSSHPPRKFRFCIPHFVVISRLTSKSLMFYALPVKK